MLAFHMYCAETAAQAAAVARAPLNQYLKSIVDAASGFLTGVSSRDYPNYQKMIEGLARETFESQLEKGLAWIGTPEEIRGAIDAYHRGIGGFESASLQVNFGMVECPARPLAHAMVSALDEPALAMARAGCRRPSASRMTSTSFRFIIW